MPHRLGRLPEDQSRPRLRLSPHVRTGTAPPPSVDWYSHVAAWGTLANDKFGDCVFAGNGHIIEQQTALGEGREVILTDAEVLAEYSRVTGFNPDDPSTDQGAQVQDGLADLRRNGLAGQRIAAFARCDTGSITEIKAALAEFGVVDLGVTLPASAEQQFASGEPWTVVPDDGGVLGGHCVVAFGYDADYIFLATWGRIVPASWQWFTTYCDEAWAVVSAAWAGQDGKDPEGVDLASLGTEFAALTGEPDPFAQPAPQPPAPSVHPGILAEVAAELRAFMARIEKLLRQFGL